MDECHDLGYLVRTPWRMKSDVEYLREEVATDVQRGRLDRDGGASRRECDDSYLSAVLEVDLILNILFEKCATYTETSWDACVSACQFLADFRFYSVAFATRIAP